MLTYFFDLVYQLTKFIIRLSAFKKFLMSFIGRKMAENWQKMAAVHLSAKANYKALSVGAEKNAAPLVNQEFIPGL